MSRNLARNMMMSDDAMLAGAIADYFKRMEIDWGKSRLQVVPLGSVQSEINSASWAVGDKRWAEDAFDPMISADDSGLLADAPEGYSGDDILSIDFEELDETEGLVPLSEGRDGPANDRDARKRAPETHLAPVGAARGIESRTEHFESESEEEEDDVLPTDKASACLLVLSGVISVGLVAAFFHFV